MVYILLAEGFEEMEALVPADLLRRAGAEVALVGLDAPVITGSHRISVSTDLRLEDVSLRSSDMLVLPGGLGGVMSMKASPSATDLIRNAHRTGCWLAAICAAPTLLGHLGILKGRKAVCYPGMEDQLTDAIVTADQAVVTDGKIITSRAAGSAYEIGFALISALFDHQKSEEVRYGIKYRFGEDPVKS